MSAFDDRYGELVSHIGAIGTEFIAPYLPADPSVSPVDYELSVKAYCLLAHAAIEEYLESVALGVMIACIDNWTVSRKYADSLTTLVARYGLTFEVVEKNVAYEKRVVDHLKELFDEAKRRFSQDVFDNNGISIDYLKQLFLPLAIDIDSDVNVINSINKLSKERGSYAHKGGARVVLSPEDARNFVVDCLKLCEDIRIKANTKL